MPVCMSGYVAVRGGVGNAGSVVPGPSHTLSPPDLPLIALDLDPKDESDTESIEANTVSQFIVPGSTPNRIWSSMKRCITCNIKML